MKIIFAGYTGLVGSALVSSLTAAGHQIARLVRSADKAAPGNEVWNPFGEASR